MGIPTDPFAIPLACRTMQAKFAPQEIRVVLVIEARIPRLMILLLPSLIAYSGHGHTDECGMLASASTRAAVSIQILNIECY